MGALRSLLHDSGNLLHIAGNFAGSGCLFFGCRGNLVHLHGNIVNLHQNILKRLPRFCRFHRTGFHLLNSLLHGCHGAFGFLLNGLDHFSNLFGGAGGAFGKGAHFIGDNGKSATLLAGAGGFDGRIERKQVGLIGDIFNCVLLIRIRS